MGWTERESVCARSECARGFGFSVNAKKNI